MRREYVLLLKSIFTISNLIFGSISPETQLCILQLNLTPSHITCVTAVCVKGRLGTNVFHVQNKLPAEC